MTADEINFLRSQIQNYIAEADADWIPVPGQLELHGSRCRFGVLLSSCFGALFVADLIVGMEELELQLPARPKFQPPKQSKIILRSNSFCNYYNALFI